MKNKSLITALLAIAFLAIGCKQQASRGTSSSDSATANQIEAVKKDTAEATREIKDFAYAEKSAFVTKMQAELNDINREIDVLTAKVANSSDAVKAEAKPKLEALRAQTAVLEQHLDRVKSATASTWENVKDAFAQAYDSTKEGFQQARSWVSEKIAS